MIKYRGQYRVVLPLDSCGNSTLNQDDTYLKCKNNTEIYRYNDNTLAIYFVSTGFANNRIKELTDLGVNLQLFQKCSDESVYLFAESDFNKVAKVLSPRSKGANKSPKVNANRKKRELTEEQRQILRDRMKKLSRKTIK